MTMHPPVAQAILDFHGLRQLESNSESVGGLPAWVVGLLLICGLCCCLAALGKYQYDAMGAHGPTSALFLSWVCAAACAHKPRCKLYMYWLNLN